MTTHLPPQGAASLPPLPEPHKTLGQVTTELQFKGFDPVGERVVCDQRYPVFTAEQMREYGELCRASLSSSPEDAKGTGVQVHPTAPVCESASRPSADVPGTGESAPRLDGGCVIHGLAHPCETCASESR